MRLVAGPAETTPFQTAMDFPVHHSRRGSCVVWCAHPLNALAWAIAVAPDLGKGGREKYVLGPRGKKMCAKGYRIVRDSAEQLFFTTPFYLTLCDRPRGKTPTRNTEDFI